MASNSSTSALMTVLSFWMVGSAGKASTAAPSKRVAVTLSSVGSYRLGVKFSNIVISKTTFVTTSSGATWPDVDCSPTRGI